MMDPELGGNGMRAPAFNKMIAKDLRFEFRVNHQGLSPVIQGRSSRPFGYWVSLRRPQKVVSEEGITLAVAEMAIKALLSVIMRDLWTNLHGVQRQ
jgi:hypothetical protein